MLPTATAAWPVRISISSPGSDPGITASGCSHAGRGRRTGSGGGGGCGIESKKLQRTRPTAGHPTPARTALPAAEPQRRALPLVRDEEAVRNHDETAASGERCLDGSAGRSHGANEADDSL